MTILDYQKAIDNWAQNLKKPYWSPLSQLARLTEEVGELARVYNHKYGDKVKKASEEEDDLEGELGDIFFVLLAMANSEEIQLEDALIKVIEKTKTRDRDRFEKKSV